LLQTITHKQINPKVLPLRFSFMTTRPRQLWWAIPILHIWILIQTESCFIDSKWNLGPFNRYPSGGFQGRGIAFSLC